MKNILLLLTLASSLQTFAAEPTPAAASTSSPSIGMRLWLGVGSGSLNNGTSTYTPAVVSLGYDFNFGSELQWIAGVRFEGIATSETSNDPNVGNVHRNGSLVSGGYFLVPHLLYAKVSLGIGAPTASGTFASNAYNFMAGASVGIRFKVAGSFNGGLELEYQSFGSTSCAQNYSIPGFTSCPSIPSANLVALNAIFGFDLGRSHDENH